VLLVFAVIVGFTLGMLLGQRWVRSHGVPPRQQSGVAPVREQGRAPEVIIEPSKSEEPGGEPGERRKRTQAGLAVALAARGSSDRAALCAKRGFLQ
jgi:hypothetical protein